MADNDGYATVDSPFGAVGLLEAHAPDVALVHGAIADRDGNVAFHPPLLEGVWGALAARRGAIVTVEQVVDDIRPWAHLVRLPAHRVLSVSECPMGAHPGGLYGRFTPAEPYGEDVDFWAEVRDASRRDDFDDWIRERVLDVEDHDGWIAKLGDRPGGPAARSGPTRTRGGTTRPPTRPTSRPPPNAWETAAAFGARVLADRIVALGADTALAGAGRRQPRDVARGADGAGAAGRRCVLCAELGLWGYEPTPADPFVFNHRAFPSATMLADSSEILGMVMPGPGTTSVACLGAAIIDAERQHRLHRDPGPGVPRRVGRRERRRLGGRRRGGRDDPHAAADGGGGAVRDLAGRHGCPTSSPTSACSRSATAASC